MNASIMDPLPGDFPEVERKIKCFGQCGYVEAEAPSARRTRTAAPILINICFSSSFTPSPRFLMPFFAAAITFAAMESSSVHFSRSTALPELLLFLFAFSKIFGTAPASLLLSLASLSFCRLLLSNQVLTELGPLAVSVALPQQQKQLEFLKREGLVETAPFVIPKRPLSINLNYTRGSRKLIASCLLQWRVKFMRMLTYEG
ncbi:hypothetical protein Prudu_005731 [Prunus dulcis]|uniref:Uncharacterized protein n=1 Tax=Prunus dulcis TaxID=3755 RepID=A0A4Y1QYD8_PRUDU|nr:hypothetical protein Prudu_005731 [Prunus dulcis]